MVGKKPDQFITSLPFDEMNDKNLAFLLLWLSFVEKVKHATVHILATWARPASSVWCLFWSQFMILFTQWIFRWKLRLLKTFLYDELWYFWFPVNVAMKETCVSSRSFWALCVSFSPVTCRWQWLVFRVWPYLPLLLSVRVCWWCAHVLSRVNSFHSHYHDHLKCFLEVALWPSVWESHFHSFTGPILYQ